MSGISFEFDFGLRRTTRLPLTCLKRARFGRTRRYGGVFGGYSVHSRSPLAQAICGSRTSAKRSPSLVGAARSAGGFFTELRNAACGGRTHARGGSARDRCGTAIRSPAGHALRIMLGRYFQADPAEISLVYQPHGKPELGSTWNERGVEFNLALGRGGLVRLHARAADRRRCRSSPADAKRGGRLMKRSSAADEIDQWRQAPRERQERVFFQGWTRKEAWLKAVGSGLSFPLDQFCRDDGWPGTSALDSRRCARQATWWRWRVAEPCRGYVAAVA